MLKILHVMESFTVGGAEKVVLELCRGLDPKRFQSSVLALATGQLQEPFAGLGPVTLLPKRKGPDLGMLWRLCQHMRRSAVDVVHVVNGLTVVNYGVTAARLSAVPVVASVHGVSHFVEPGAGANCWRKMLGLAQARIAVSDDIRNKVRGCLGAGAAVELIYNGIGGHPGCATPEFRRDLFAQWQLPEDAQVAVCVANLREIKGHAVLLQAMPGLVRRFPRLHLVLIGIGPQEAVLRELVQRLGIEHKVRFAGLRRDVPDCLEQVDLFVLPSLSEGTPLCLLEAMRAGLPVIATRVGGVPEVVIEGVTGSLVPPGRADLLQEAITSMLERPEFRRSCAESGRGRFEEQFQLSRFLQRYEQVLERTARAGAN